MMAKKGWLDRGIFPLQMAGGIVRWGVRLWFHGRPLKYQSFATKAEARALYMQIKTLIRHGLFQPDTYYRAKQKPLEVPELLYRTKTLKINDVSGIYFLQSETSGLVKIGYSKHINRRVSGIQVSHPDRLRYLGHMEGTIQQEAALHAQFAHCRYRGEWFRPDASLYLFLVSRGYDFVQCPTRTTPSTSYRIFLPEWGSDKTPTAPSPS